MSDGEESDDGLEVIYGAAVQAEHVAGYLADPFQECSTRGVRQEDYYAATHSSVRAKRAPSKHAAAAPRPSRLMNQVVDFETDVDGEYRNFEIESVGGEGRRDLDLPKPEASQERSKLKRTVHRREDSSSGSLVASKRSHRRIDPQSQSTLSRRHMAEFVAARVGSSSREQKPKQNGIRGMVEASLRATHAAAFDEDVGRLGGNRKHQASKGSASAKRGSQSTTQAPKSVDAPWGSGRTFQPDSFRPAEPPSRKASTSKRALLAEPAFRDPAAHGKSSSKPPKSIIVGSERAASVSMDRPSHWGGCSSSEKKRRKPNDDGRNVHNTDHSSKHSNTLSQTAATPAPRQSGSAQMAGRPLVNIAGGAFSTPALPRHRHHSGRGNSAASGSSSSGVGQHSTSQQRKPEDEPHGAMPSQDFLHRGTVKALPSPSEGESGNAETPGAVEREDDGLADNNDSAAYDDDGDGEDYPGSNAYNRSRSSSFHRQSQTLPLKHDQGSVPCTPLNSKTAPSSVGTTSVAQSFAPKPSPATFRTPMAPRPAFHHAREHADDAATSTGTNSVPHTWSGLKSFASTAQQQRSSDGLSSHDFGDSAGKRVKASSRCGHGPLSKRLQAQRKLLDGDVARLRSGQYQKGGAEGFAPLNAAASGDPRARALVALDLTLMPLQAPPLPVLGAGPFHSAVASGSFGLSGDANGHGLGSSAYDGAALPSFVAYVHTTTLSDDSSPAPPQPSSTQPPQTSVPNRRTTWLSLAMPSTRSDAGNNAGGDNASPPSRCAQEASELNYQFARIVFQTSTVRVSSSHSAGQKL